MAVRFSRTVGYMEEGKILIFCIGKPRTACRYRQSDPEGWELRVPEVPAVRSQRELPAAIHSHREESTALRGCSEPGHSLFLSRTWVNSEVPGLNVTSIALVVRIPSLVA